ncbi:hypothetical protein H3H37_11395 [Duganella sp. LX20W]|uniref:Solute-binding protein family 3/N-terminal domain-containing protein n=1 Tax=Rugamonas brunnea TaxID=2758569 RepID=A0A7W2ES73_9BURK|nr:hypothetical protein [Rugamonas brunnea]MBA5637659.1 hypothetical protein [Rugamonas brunnea]
MVRIANWGWIAAWALAASGWAQDAPAPLRLCVDARPHPPYVLLEREGTAQILVRMAAARVGVQVEYHHAPVARCAEEIRRNLAQGYPAAGYAPKVADFCAFSVDNKEPDPQQATAQARLMLYRRTGELVDWDGKRLLHLNGKVLSSHGALVMRDRLRALGAETDDGAADLATNFAKLLARRDDLAIGFERDGQPLIERAPFAGKIEALPVVFSQERYYLCLSHQFRDAHPELAAALWDAIPRAAASAEYKAAIKGIK